MMWALAKFFNMIGDGPFEVFFFFFVHQWFDPLARPKHCCTYKHGTIIFLYKLAVSEERNAFYIATALYNPCRQHCLEDTMFLMGFPKIIIQFIVKLWIVLSLHMPPKLFLNERSSLLLKKKKIPVNYTGSIMKCHWKDHILAGSSSFTALLFIL